MRAHAIAVAQALGIMILAQLMGVLAKLALFEVEPFTFVWLQLASALVAMVAYSLLFRRDRWTGRLTRRDWAAIVFVGAVNFGLCRLLMMMGMARLPVNTFVFVLSFVSLVTLGLSVVFLGERPGRWQGVGILLAIGGVRLYFGDLPAPDALVGVGYALVVVLGLAASNTVTRALMSKRAEPLDPVFYSTLALAVGAIPFVLAGLALDPAPSIGGVRNWAIVIANGVVGIALAQTVFNHVLRTLRSYEASVLAVSGLVWTALLAIPILGEWLEPRQVAGIGVVMGGILLAQWRPKAGSAPIA